MKAMEISESEKCVRDVGNLQVIVRCGVHRIIEWNQEEQQWNDRGITVEQPGKRYSSCPKPSP